MEDRTVIQNPVAGSLRPGTQLNRVYEIERLIANGGMGEVYRGFNIVTRDPVAIKLIRPEFASDPEIFELFRREASALHNLPHEAIVRYFVFSIDPDLRRAYLAMEFVDGPSLTDRFAAGPMPLDDVKVLQQRMASALDVAHRHGIVHRDISPDNIILPNRDVRLAKIIDFGIARSLEGKEVSIIGGRFAGKYNFASPEQFGLFGGEVTPKSDIYSFGLVLAAALRGRPIDMRGSEADAIAKRSVVPDLSDLDPTFRPLLQSMLQPLPANRPGSMAEIAAWAAAGEPRAASRAPLPPSTRGPSGNRKALPIGTAAALAGVASMAYVLRSDIPQLTHSFLAPTPPAARSKLPPLAGANPSAPAMPTQPTIAQSQTNMGRSPRDERPNESKLARTEEESPKLSNQAQQVPSADDVVDALPPSAPQPDIDLPSAVVGAQYTQALPAFLDRGGKGLRLTASGLPDGLNFVDGGQGTGVIEGDPQRSEHATIQIVATDHNNRTAQMTARLAIADQTPPAPPDVAAASKEASAPKPAGRLTEASPAGEKSAPAPAPEPATASSSAPPNGDLSPHHDAWNLPSSTLNASVSGRARAFVASFDGGDCFYITRIGSLDGKERYLGLGRTPEPFERFDSGYQAAVGAEAAIRLGQLTPEQCPALDLLRLDRAERSAEPVLEIKDQDISRGAPLAGTVSNLAGRHLYLLYVDNDGAIHRIATATQAGGDRATFSVSIKPQGSFLNANQLLVAVASPTPVPLLEATRTEPLRAIAGRIAEDARRASAAVVADYFKFVN